MCETSLIRYKVVSANSLLTGPYRSKVMLNSKGNKSKEYVNEIKNKILKLSCRRERHATLIRGSHESTLDCWRLATRSKYYRVVAVVISTPISASLLPFLCKFDIPRISEGIGGAAALTAASWHHVSGPRYPQREQVGVQAWLIKVIKGLCLFVSPWLIKAPPILHLILVHVAASAAASSKVSGILLLLPTATTPSYQELKCRRIN